MKEVIKKRLTKKSLREFLDEQVSITKLRNVLTDENERALAQELYEKECAIKLGELTKAGAKRGTKKYQRSKLRVEYGLKADIDFKSKISRLVLLQHIRNYFDLS